MWGLGGFVAECVEKRGFPWRVWLPQLCGAQGEVYLGQMLWGTGACGAVASVLHPHSLGSWKESSLTGGLAVSITQNMKLSKKVSQASVLAGRAWLFPAEAESQ